MKRVYSSFNRIAVHHARNLLDAEGVPATVKNEFLSSAMGELPPAECQTELWVREEDAAQAERIIFSDKQKNSGPPWRCAACKEESEPQFTHCWKCGMCR